ncbi:DUF2161 family putative PD-(D/E)XK-type phosphodiesterase [Cohnella rhizosphaerae]|uniref:DUF2161 family putative PD-(D/E)XK-type phosphodiesterase n=1 Tax=Cohnella rhizosphaerae TaxID=1457232 RepID=A0A9X4KPI2_9BACL|nr:DUF2161 family putative PD-(D/E)XK-type phosphodiesterase [Cohnella rhizosphaerae]MDG0808791.1 DUF2161 family putative PD-(D/E)XK-type phosphodiesterase [Cohnella rhizosphaerae]
MAVKYETELYPALKAFWTARGYEVKAEVKGCDLVALRHGESLPVIVEMKKTFTLALLLQGLERQRTGAAVWLAVERNRVKKGAHNQRFGEISDLCRRLSLGFMTVTFYKTKPPVIEVWCEIGSPADAGFRAAGGPAVGGAAGVAEIVEGAERYAAAAAAAPLVPVAVPTARSGGRRKGAAKLLKEFAGRSGDYNVGGSTKRKLVTAYRERALQCALALRCAEAPALAPREVGALTRVADPGQLLRSNYYGWFAKAGRGLYALTPAGRAALDEYAEAVSYWTTRFPWASVAASAGQTESQSDHSDVRFGDAADPANPRFDGAAEDEAAESTTYYIEELHRS